MKIPCSNCNQRLEIPEELAGQTIECPSCNASLAVPAIEAPPSTTPRVEVATPQASAPQKSAPQRKTPAPPKAASSKKSKSLIPKLAIAAVVAVLLVIALGVFFSSGVDVLEAAAEGNINVVRQAIAKGANLNVKDEDGETPLLWAAMFGHKEVAELLIVKGADVNAMTNGGKTPLDVAKIESWDTSKVEAAKNKISGLLLENGAKTGWNIKMVKRSIQVASKTGDIKWVKQHLEDGMDVNAVGQAIQYPRVAQSDAAWTSLHWAALEGHKEIVELLIAKGATVDSKKTDGWTPLHEATRKGHKEIVELLIRKGADANAMTYDGESALNLSEGKIDIESILNQAGGKTGIGISIWKAAAEGNTEAIKQHIAAGTDVNAVLKMGGHTPLHGAVDRNQSEAVEILIARGADINARVSNNKNGATPLDIAKFLGRSKIGETLREHGAKTGEELKAEGK
jgi:ankyrin repeat protein